METGEIHRDFILYTPYYISPHAERNEENLYCLQKNLDNPLIKKVVLINEEKQLPFEHHKLTQIPGKARPDFSEIFAEIGNHKQDGAILILANSDIYFDESLEKAKNIKKGEIYALTRWDLQTDGTKKFFLKYHSQDAWIFNEDIEKSIGAFPMGQPGCDNRLVYEFKRCGYKVKNPSFSIHITHVHASGFRPYLNEDGIKKVEGKYAYLIPSYLDVKPKDKKSFYYIRYEYFLHKFQGKLERVESNFFENKLAIIPSLYYLLLFKYCK